MKVAILADSHWGVRNDSPMFLEYFTRFYREQFFPYLKEHDIKTVVHLGDLVDRRKYINYTTANVMRNEYLTPSQELGLDTRIIVGNHDTFYKDTNEINALREIVMGKNGFKVYSNPADAVFDGLNCLMLPWICPENQAQSMDMIKNFKGKVVFSHLELAGFEMSKGQLMEHGMDAAIFKKYKAVYSGHYHHKSSKGNIHYLGAPYEMTWVDYEDPKGFHILDTDTLKLEFIQNPLKMHQKIHYDNGTETEEVEGKIVRLIVHDKGDLKKFDKFVQKFGETEIKIIDEHLNFDPTDSKKLEVENVGDTLKILTDYVSDLEVNVDKKQLNKLLKELYAEAQLER